MYYFNSSRIQALQIDMGSAEPYFFRRGTGNTKDVGKPIWPQIGF